MDSGEIKVLLVGQTARSSFQLLQWLDNHGCQCHFASSCEDACILISETAFDLVISQSELPDRTAYPLLDRLVGSTATLFFSKPVENRCWCAAGNASEHTGYDPANSWTHLERR